MKSLIVVLAILSAAVVGCTRGHGDPVPAKKTSSDTPAQPATAQQTDDQGQVVPKCVARDQDDLLQIHGQLTTYSITAAKESEESTRYAYDVPSQVDHLTKAHDAATNAVSLCDNQEDAKKADADCEIAEVKELYLSLGDVCSKLRDMKANLENTISHTY